MFEPTRINRICWEQKTFGLILLPVNAVALVVYFVLTPFYSGPALLRLLALPIVFVLNIVWVVCLGIIAMSSKTSLRMQLLRPVIFIIALPILIVGYFGVAISPIGSMHDASLKNQKLILVESYPFCIWL